MENKKLTYYLLFGLIVLASFYAGGLSRSSAYSFRSEPTRQNVITYDYITSQADSLKGVDILNRNKENDPAPDENGQEKENGFINNLINRGINSFDFTFPNIFDFL